LRSKGGLYPPFPNTWSDTHKPFAELPLGATAIEFEGKVNFLFLSLFYSQFVISLLICLFPMWLNRFRFSKVAKKQANFYIIFFNVLHFGNDLL
jgi:hypothetical protein